MVSLMDCATQILNKLLTGEGHGLSANVGQSTPYATYNLTPHAPSPLKGTMNLQGSVSGTIATMDVICNSNP